jgi:hypothetical protein
MLPVVTAVATWAMLWFAGTTVTLALAVIRLLLARRPD